MVVSDSSTTAIAVTRSWLSYITLHLKGGADCFVDSFWAFLLHTKYIPPAGDRAAADTS